MILVVGASGRLGSRVARLLLARGTPVRAMSRDASTLAELSRLGAETFERVTGRTGRKTHVPLPLMRVMTTLMRPIKPALSRQIAAGVYMDTENQTLDMTETLKRFPMRLSRLEDLVRAQFASGPFMEKSRD